MLITYDARSLDPRWRHKGVGVVLSNLVHRLEAKFTLLGLAPRFPAPVSEAIRFWPSPSRKMDFFLSEVSPWLVHDSDLYWGPNNSLPAVVRGPSVITVHDVLLFRYPLDQPWSRLVRPRLASAIRRATRLVAISRTTADDLITIFPEASQKIEVIHNGYTPNEACPDTEHGEVMAPYAVVLGAQRPRKNLGLAISAVAAARERDPNLRLVVTGDINPQFAAEVALSREFVDCVGVVSRHRLFQLLRNAVALLFPSYYEGFGLPLLEAMSVGCPVIALDTPINREIGGEAACFAPDSAESWGRELLRMHLDRNWRAELVERSRVNLQRFSWDRAAHQYGSVFTSVCGAW
jgi:glycosyltransferase involved in cell wall biosynthesis